MPKIKPKTKKLKTAEKTERLYFAYGSNLNLPQMEMRCPKAVPLRTLAIKNWKLVFRGVADIEPCQGGVVLGALYDITRECERALDRYEGFRPNDPFAGLYRKVECQLPDGTRFFFYKMNRGNIDPPSEYYFNVIEEGFGHWGLDKRLLEQALDHSWEGRSAA